MIYSSIIEWNFYKCLTYVIYRRRIAVFIVAELSSRHAIGRRFCWKLDMHQAIPSRALNSILYVRMTVHLWYVNKGENQLDATNGDLLVINFSSTCFVRQEVRLRFTAYGFCPVVAVVMLESLVARCVHCVEDVAQCTHLVSGLQDAAASCKPDT